MRAIADTTRFDYYCWDLYARVTEWYEEDKDRLKIRTAALHDIEHGGNDTADLAAFIADRIVRCHLKTMRRMNIGYDLLTWEGDILRLHFWTHAFEFLKKTGAVFLQTEGKLKGCWVMRIDDDEATPDAEDRQTPRRGGRRRRRRRAAREGHRPVRRDGHLRRQGHGVPALEVRAARQGLPLPRLRDGTPLAVVDDVDAERSRSPQLRHSAARPGSATSSTRASRTCRSCQAGAGARSAITQQAAHSVHYSYEMVALSHATARELGYDAERRRRPAVRRGVRPQGARRQGRRPARSADDKAAAEVAEAQSRAAGRRDARRIAEAIAIAAVRYFMVKFSRGKVIVFDIDEALSFEGESGPYLQYAVVRANNIFNKLKERDGIDEAARAAPRCRRLRRTC